MVPMVIVLAGMMAMLRFSGFALAGRDLPAPVERSLSALLIATLSALIATSFAGSDRHGAAALALMLAAFCMWRWRRLWLTLAVGLAAFTIMARLLYQEVNLT